ncbi:reverse transcriptase domain-containing protein, partial [Tanacetum coccineum]
FECGAPGHFKRDCPKLKNKDGGNGNAQGWIYAVGNAEKRGNASGNPDANIVTGTGTDISQKDKKPSKKRQNRTRDGKVCEDEAQSKSSQLREEKAKKNVT